MIGVNRNLETGFFELLRVELRDGVPVYVAQPMGGPPTEFAAATIADGDALFRNPDHDFPTDIRYQLDGATLVAAASAGSRTLGWRWEPVMPAPWSVQPGRIGWLDLTVPHAAAARDFYCQVTGWTSVATDMDGYEDHSLIAPDGVVVAGICHARGDNVHIPPGWVPYFVVDDLDDAADRAIDLGATQVADAMDFRVFRDPHGAVFALYGV